MAPFAMTDTTWIQGSIGVLTAALLTAVARWVWPKKKLFAQANWALVLVSALMVAIGLAQRSMAAGYFALSNMYESMLMLVLSVMAGYLYLDARLRQQKFNLAGWGWPLMLLLLIALNFALSLPTDIKPLQAALQSYWRSIHVPIIISAYGFFTLAFIASLVHLVLHAQKKDTRLYDELTHKSVAIGFPLLAIGIILGGLWANEAWGNYWSWDPKESMSLVTLLVYGAYLHLRVREGLTLTPATYAWVSIAGYVMMLVTYFGVNIMGLGLHSYGKIG
ncbi:MAG: cytochrome c biogenesis protein CcsA [Vampirovibrionales bacterium]|nr:cytochrome c biogenesis protein CcsA [Vampirovibrionales bacterium]